MIKKKTNTKTNTKKGDDMRDLFFIIKGQYRKGATPKVTNRLTGNDVFLGGYDPEDENTIEWYMLLDRKTFRCCVCSNDINKCLAGVKNIIIRYKGVGKNYFKHISKTTSDDYYEVHYLGHKPMTSMEREKKSKNKYPRVSPIMRCVYEEIDKHYGHYYRDLISEAEEEAYEVLKGEKPVFKSRKLMSKHKTNTKSVEVTETPKEVIENTTPKKMVKPKVKMGIKKLNMN